MKKSKKQQPLFICLYLMNIYIIVIHPPAQPAPHPQYPHHLSKRGWGVWRNESRLFRVQEGDIHLMSPFARTISILKPQTREIPTALCPGLGKNRGSRNKQLHSQELPPCTWVGGWSRGSDVPGEGSAFPMAWSIYFSTLSGST